ncbi:MAG: amino acid permease [Selenomonadaceae bacterium]|nr:amino acid permease [Selenomonadaceae bacterium]
MDTAENTKLKPYLSPLNVWALSFGCAVGWGAFVMPGTTFLPIGGPLGTALGMAIGGIIMLIIGYNYHFMMNKYPDAGGTYSYAKKVLGYDHGFLSSWFLILVYIAITWANATALPLIFRRFTGDMFQFGFHYQIAGFDIWFGEALLSLGALWIFGAICMRGGKLAAWVQTVCAIILFGGVLICFGAVVSSGVNVFEISPAMKPEGGSSFAAIFGIVVLAPWAFAGFESISQSAEGFTFSVKKTFAILFCSVVSAAMAYTFLAIIAISTLPAGCTSWVDYLGNLDDYEGLATLPTAHAVNFFMGDTGIILLAVTIMGGVITGLVGNYIAASRLIYALTRDDLLPPWFGKLNENHTPMNAVFFIMLLSLPIPFLGRTAIAWIIDVNTIGATIDYTYTSIVTLITARAMGKSLPQFTGIVGCVVSAIFFLYFMVPNAWTVSAMTTESYLILILWSILGFVFFRYIFQRDTELRRFGQSTISWIALLFLIFFTSMLWVRESTNDAAKEVLGNLSEYYIEEMNEHGIPQSDREKADSAYYLENQMEIVSSSLNNHNFMQMGLIAISLFIMFNIYNLMMKREKNMEVQKVQAERSNKAKSTFLSNMSHDIRTPMNAIVGYVNLSKKLYKLCENCPRERCPDEVPKKACDYLNKIDASSGHLLALINDILDMSRIESGKMELDPQKSNLVKALNDVRDLFATQMETKGLKFAVNVEHVMNKTVMCDTPRLNRVLLNLISNAFKFTPEGGAVTVTLRQTGGNEEVGNYELRVKDSGMGMTPEFAKKVFAAYERDRTVSNIQGTGLGMSITKSIVELMGGTIDVETELGKGTEFIVRVNFPIVDEPDEVPDENISDTQREIDFSKVKLLLVEDNEVNREIATLILTEFGFQLDTAENGKVAYEKVAMSKPGDFDVVLMDVQMPVMNGYEATAKIRQLSNQKLANIPIIAMTANAFTEDIQAAKDAGMDGHIAKPLDIPKMIETLTEVLK